MGKRGKYARCMNVKYKNKIKCKKYKKRIQGREVLHVQL